MQESVSLSGSLVNTKPPIIHPFPSCNPCSPSAASSYTAYPTLHTIITSCPDSSLSSSLSGLINNVLYVIILSAALDLVGPTIPKSAVLLFDVIPSFLVKLTAPYYIHNVPYSLRILMFAGLSTCGMLLIALTPSAIADGQGKPVVPDKGEILVKMCGVVFASLSSGGGELSFLGLTHFYGPFSLAAWSSGTGGAGLVGAGAYVIATTSIGLSVRTSLLAFSFLPIVMLLSFFLVLPQEPLRVRLERKPSYHAIVDADDEGVASDSVHGGLLGQHLNNREDEDEDERGHVHSSVSSSYVLQQSSSNRWHKFTANFYRARGLFFP